MKKTGACLCALSLSLVFIAAAPAAAGDAPDGWWSGVGLSAKADPREAGSEAAEEAKRKLGASPAKIVVVAAAEPQVTPELVEGVAAHFDRKIIYGCQVASPLVTEGNFPDAVSLDIEAGVAVWALGGDADIEIAVVETDPDSDDAYYTAGGQMAELLRPALEKTSRPGKLVVTFGDQYNGSNKDYAMGLNDGLEEIHPIIGAAAGNTTAKVVVAGAIRTGVNVGILVAGDFTLGQAMNGGTHTPETADKTLAEAIAQGDGKEPFFALVFNCRRRRQGMIERGQLAEELGVINKNLAGVDYFGFYGPGEIGAKAPGEKAEGVGFTVVTAVFFKR
ncbi:MAG: FIST C-terminal domain-containing protein [Planctomycetota bacterium]|jgi:hypothetical protein|nr:FIST C-terminal domain-containing protein [Planctomycetota bacterium]